jgi:hypothetical protein
MSVIMYVYFVILPTILSGILSCKQLYYSSFRYIVILPTLWSHNQPQYQIIILLFNQPQCLVYCHITSHMVCYIAGYFMRQANYHILLLTTFIYGDVSMFVQFMLTLYQHYDVRIATTLVNS